ncbi:DUF6706 family protein [Sphingobacterium sp.]|uniref:DUF6706 family protein n=1 Tax=Sphingobacterium sp. TaxID=341027 RepID=UPI00289B3658|nr:DUF6706 family protein [Sphingobacterium sp.]
MNNKEALQFEFGQKVPDGVLSTQLIKAGLNPENDFDPTTGENSKMMDLALAGLLFWICTNRKSIKELDFQVTQNDVDDWLKLRSILLKRWGVPDELDDEGPVIESVSDLW